MRRLRWISLFLGCLLALMSLADATVLAAGPIVHAVLFFSPTCPHCHAVMTETLPPLQERYGSQLSILNVDVSQAQGNALYAEAIRTFAIPDERQGVPMLILGQTVLVGGAEIPQQLPALIEQGLAAGGVDWPVLAGLQDLVQTQGVAPAPGEEALAPFQRDPLGNSLSLVVLAGMVASLATLGAGLAGKRSFTGTWPGWVIPLLCVLGLGVASYLSYVELSQTQAFCGPVGHCNAVQQSPYARLFGVLPIGILGVLGYLGVLASWVVARARPSSRFWASLPAGLALVGVVFSIYLTTLEPFVIGATCLWCLTSAVLMTLLLWAALPIAAGAWFRSPARGRAKRSGSRR